MLTGYRIFIKQLSILIFVSLCKPVLAQEFCKENYFGVAENPQVKSFLLDSDFFDIKIDSLIQNRKISDLDDISTLGVMKLTMIVDTLGFGYLYIIDDNYVGNQILNRQMLFDFLNKENRIKGAKWSPASCNFSEVISFYTLTIRISLN